MCSFSTVSSACGFRWTEGSTRSDLVRWLVYSSSISARFSLPGDFDDEEFYDEEFDDEKFDDEVLHYEDFAEEVFLSMRIFSDEHLQLRRRPG